MCSPRSIDSTWRFGKRKNYWHAGVYIILIPDDNVFAKLRLARRSREDRGVEDLLLRIFALTGAPITIFNLTQPATFWVEGLRSTFCAIADHHRHFRRLHLESIHQFL
jgi:hypothetical protein